MPEPQNPQSHFVSGLIRQLARQIFLGDLHLIHHLFLDF